MLMEILEKGSYSHLVIRDVLDKYNYSDSRDKAFVKRVTEGTLERLIQIDYCLNRFSSVPVPKMKPLIRTLMRMSAYQLLFMDKIPDSAVCNEAVKLAGKRGFRGLSGFVNGVLRTLARNKKGLPYPDREKEPVKYLSVKYSMPEFLIGLWTEGYGEEKTHILLEALLKESPLRLRLKESLSDRERQEWELALADDGVRVRRHPYLSYAYELWNVENVKSLPGYREGFFVVQDVSSMLAAEAAGISGAGAAAGDELPVGAAEAATEPDKSGELPEGAAEAAGAEKAAERAGEFLVVDVCAAPGGKSMHLAEKLGNRGKVISRDVSEYKAALLRDNIERTGLTNVEVQVHDACILDESLTEKADVVLADLPCSGLGVIGKKRDIKYRITKEAVSELVKLQRQILDVVWRYVKPGGVLVYSTCTINPDENEKTVRWFADNYPFAPESLSPYLPAELKGEGEEGMLQLFPGLHETDGFFIARMRRKG